MGFAFCSYILAHPASGGGGLVSFKDTPRHQNCQDKLLCIASAAKGETLDLIRLDFIAKPYEQSTCMNSHE